jgi:hypothetical protein
LRRELPSLDDLAETTLNGEHVRMTHSDFASLTAAVRAARWGWKKGLQLAFVGLLTLAGHVVVRLVFK